MKMKSIFVNDDGFEYENIAAFVESQIENTWGDNGELENMKGTIKGLLEFVGKLSQTLVETGALSDSQLFEVVKGYRP